MAGNHPSTSQTQRNWLLDIALFLAFLVSTAPHFTGMTVHEWLGILLGAGIVIHLILQWQWLATVTRRFFGKLPAPTRINAILNILLFVSMTLTIFSGLLISESALPLLGIQLAAGGAWTMLHKLSADAILFVVAAHIGLHGSWLVSAFRTYLLKPLARAVRRQPNRTVVTGNLEVQS